MIPLAELTAFLQVVMIDLTLAGDNAVVVGMVAAALPREQRKRVIAVGVLVATVLRVVFAVAVAELLQIIGLTLAGGLLLLWVCWKLWREIREQRLAAHPAAGAGAGAPRPKTMRQAVIQIALADISMSLDNVLGVAGAAGGHYWVLAAGLVLSVLLMGVAASFIAELLKRHHWIAYLGLLVVLYVAAAMIWQGAVAVLNAADVTG